MSSINYFQTKVAAVNCLWDMTAALSLQWVSGNRRKQEHEYIKYITLYKVFMFPNLCLGTTN